MDFKLIVQTEVVSFNYRTSFSLNAWFFCVTSLSDSLSRFPAFSAGCMCLMKVMMAHSHLNLCACFDWSTFFPR